MAGESHALVNRVAGPFMSSASSSTVAEVAVRSCVHAGKVFFSVCFTGGQGYRGGKRNVARGVGGGGGGGDGTRVLRATTTTRIHSLSFALSIYLSIYSSISIFLYVTSIHRLKDKMNLKQCVDYSRIIFVQKNKWIYLDSTN